MKKEMLLIFLGIFVLAVSVVVIAKPNAPEFSMPEHAVQVSEGVYSLGQARDTDGRIVEGFMFVHNKRENAKPDGTPGGGPKNKGGTSCYSFLAKGAKWKITEPYIVDPNNNRNLDAVGIRNVLLEAINEWESAASFDILGNEVPEAVNRATIGELNEKNEVMFADIEGTNTIGVTIVWGIFGGNPNNRKLVEWDQVYDDVTFDWSLSGEAGKMDFENIAQHELGHSIGMGHAPTTTDCVEETMYPTAGYGETNKRDLNLGDIAGVNDLY